MSLPALYNPDLAKSLDELQWASKGMRHPVATRLAAGTALFRFASTRKTDTGAPIPPEQWPRGPWWFQEADYRLILHRYGKGKLGLGTVARSAGAVQPSWSLMDVSVKAYLLCDALVYTGRGSTQYRDPLPNGMVVTQAGWPEITQVYLPGMRREPPAVPAYDILRVVRKHIVTTDSFGFPPQ